MTSPAIHTVPRARRGKALVAMSGGVDSSVAAAMLVREGWEVIGCFMRLGSPDEAPAGGPLGGPTLRGGSGRPKSGSPTLRGGSGSPTLRGGRGGSVGGLGPTGETCDLDAEGSIIDGKESREIEPPRSVGAPDPPRSVGAPDPARSGGPPRPHRQGCCSVGDAADARQVAAELGIPLYVCNFRKDFGRIIDYFVGEYAAGRTPNPCVRCNDWLKFGKLHDYARQLGATHVASGHYARIEPDATGELRLMRGVDHAKDQSYVLFGIPRAQLASTLFPVGSFADKSAVRDEARRLGLPVFDKPDSYEICFVPGNDYASFAERQRPELRIEGRVLDTAGREIGRHQGQHRFTIGQRRGLGIGGSVMGGAPAYVVDRDPQTNTVTLGGPEDLLVTGCAVGEANWLVDPARFDQWTPALAQYRAHGAAAPCRVRRRGPAGFEVSFDTPQRAVAPGQALALYEEDGIVLGGGWIVDCAGKK